MFFLPFCDFFFHFISGILLRVDCNFDETKLMFIFLSLLVLFLHLTEEIFAYPKVLKIFLLNIFLEFYNF